MAVRTVVFGLAIGLLGVVHDAALPIAAATARPTASNDDDLYIDLPDDTSRYVALGDSYSAGEGVEPYEPRSGDYPEGDDCHRSLLAYPRLLTFDHGVEVTFRAC